MPFAVERTRELAAPPDEVWDVLADFGAISLWAPDVDHSCSLDDRAAEGARRRIQVGRTTLVEEVTVWRPTRELAYLIHGLPPRVGTVANHWTLGPDGDAGTRATVTTTVDSGPRPPQRLLERLVARRLSAASDGMLAGLGTHLTTPAAKRAPT